ncbi:MAG: hypothetical protein ACI8Q1_003370 [Parvicella sp.]|jgi:hypothetical protein
MITFFRKIRQRLLNKGKTAKYLTYALGEVALVMIGILLALQINNWNSDRIDSKKETRYLHSLIRDLESQILQIDYKVERELLGRKHMEHSWRNSAKLKRYNSLTTICSSSTH